MFHRNKNERSDKADHAIKDAQQNLQDVRSLSYDVHVTAAEARALRYRNHFAEQLTEMLAPRPKRKA